MNILMYEKHRAQYRCRPWVCVTSSKTHIYCISIGVREFGLGGTMWSKREASQDPEHNFKVREPMYVDDLAIRRLAPTKNMDGDVKGIMTITRQTF